MRFGTWNVRSLYRAGSLIAATRELARYKLDLVGVQQVRWDKGAQYDQRIINFSMDKETKIINLEQDFLYTTEYYQQLRDLSKAPCSRTETFISTPGLLLVGRLTTRLITY